MNIYAIRIENDETIVVTAANAQEALARAGLPACLLLESEGRTEGRSASLTERYNVVEVNHLYLRFRCDPRCRFDLYDADLPTFESLFDLHPTVTLGAMK